MMSRHRLLTYSVKTSPWLVAFQICGISLLGVRDKHSLLNLTVWVLGLELVRVLRLFFRVFFLCFVFSVFAFS